MTYKLHTLHDLLAVPIERRAVCLRQIEYALALHELACGEDAQNVTLHGVEWTDDGDDSVRFFSPDGELLLALEVGKEGE